MRKNIKADIYDTYTPTTYVRRSVNGLGSSSQIQDVSQESNKIIITSVATPNRSVVTHQVPTTTSDALIRWIAGYSRNGYTRKRYSYTSDLWRTIGYDAKKYAFMGVRNPIASTRAELNNSDFKKSITTKIIAKLK